MVSSHGCRLRILFVIMGAVPLCIILRIASMLDTSPAPVLSLLGFPRSVFVLLLVLTLGGVAGCGTDDGASYDMSWLIGASSTFEATSEGAVSEAIAGTATFRTDADGNLIGIELMHIDDSTRGLSIEMEPRPIEPRTYTVVDPGLMGVERPDAPAGFIAFFEGDTHSFRASRGTLQVARADPARVRGSFEIEMEAQASGRGGVAGGDVTVQGTFQATRRDE